MLTLLKPLPIAIVFITTLGLFMHDTKTDSATLMVIAEPGSSVHSTNTKSISTSNEHIHVEKASVGSQNRASSLRLSTPRIQARDDHSQYVQSKKSMHAGGDGVSLWPSV